MNPDTITQAQWQKLTMSQKTILKAYQDLDKVLESLLCNVTPNEPELNGDIGEVANTVWTTKQIIKGILTKGN